MRQWRYEVAKIKPKQTLLKQPAMHMAMRMRWMAATRVEEGGSKCEDGQGHARVCRQRMSKENCISSSSILFSPHPSTPHTATPPIHHHLSSTTTTTTTLPQPPPSSPVPCHRTPSGPKCCRTPPPSAHALQTPPAPQHPHISIHLSNPHHTPIT